MRIRTIKPEFWTNEKMSALPDFTRLLAIGLLNYCDDFGYFWANPLMIRGAIFPFDDDSKKILRGLAELSCEGYLRLGETADGRSCGQVIHFTKHQRVDKPKASEIEQIAKFQDSSSKPLGCVLDELALERKGKEGIGKEGKGSSEETDAFFDAWNNSSPPLPKCLSRTTKRRAAVSTRLKDQFFLENYLAAIQRSVTSDFLLGKTDRGNWKMDLDFFLKPDSVAKIMEGKYDNPANGHKVAERSGPMVVAQASEHDLL